MSRPSTADPVHHAPAHPEAVPLGGKVLTPSFLFILALTSLQLRLARWREPA